MRQYMKRQPSLSIVVERILFITTLAVILSISVAPQSSSSAQAQEEPHGARPTNLRAESTAEGIILTWQAPADGNVTGYRIHRQWLSGLEELTYVVNLPSDTTYTDTRIEPGILYLYHVRAIFAGDTLGDWSRSVNVRAPPVLVGIAPPAPPIYRWRIMDGELPPGMFLDECTGALYGVPGEVGHYSVSVDVRRLYNLSGECRSTAE